MVSQADLFAAELGPGSITDNEYARLVAKAGVPFGVYSMMDLYRMVDEIPRWPLGRYSSVGPPPPDFTDDFNRADGALGGSWTVLLGTINIVSNEITTADAEAIATFNGSADSSQYGKITRTSATGTQSVLLRTTDANNFYMGRWNSAHTRWEIYKRVAGVLTLLASDAINPLTDTFTFRASGNTLEILNDVDAVVLSTTATDHTYGSIGIRMQSTNKLDNFEGGSLAAAAATEFSDNFNRADGALGANWTLVANTIDILTNQARCTLTVQAVAFANSVLPIQDCFAEAQIAVANQLNGVYVRATAGVDTGYFFGYQSTVTACRLYRYNAGVLTQLASASGALVAPFTVRLEAIGSTLKGYVDGVEKLSAVDNTLSGDRCGMRMQNTTARVDNFAMGIVG